MISWVCLFAVGTGANELHVVEVGLAIRAVAGFCDGNRETVALVHLNRTGMVDRARDIDVELYRAGHVNDVAFPRRLVQIGIRPGGAVSAARPA